MKMLMKKQTFKKLVAVVLVFIFCFPGSSETKDVNTAGAEENKENCHCIEYNDLTELFHKMVQAYDNNETASLGKNIILPMDEEAMVKEGSQYLKEIEQKLKGKYLVDTVHISDDLTVYLTANIDTYEFYLLVSNATKEKHNVTVCIADQMDINKEATAYSFNGAEPKETEAVSGSAITSPAEVNKETNSEVTEPEASETPSSDIKLLSNKEAIVLEEDSKPTDATETPAVSETETPAAKKTVAPKASLEIGKMKCALTYANNSISIASTPNTATSTEFIYNSGEVGPTISKKAQKNADGSYKVTLTVAGNNEIIQRNKPINLVLALDVSNSMYWSMQETALGVGLDVRSEPNHYAWTSTSPESRWRVLKRSVNQIVDDVLNVNGSQISIVMFSGSNWSDEGNSKEAKVLTEFSGDKNLVKSSYENKELYQLTNGSSINPPNCGKGGTNGEAGFLAAKNQLSQVKNNGNENYVVYVSDGVANRCLNNDRSINTMSSNTTQEFQRVAKEAIEEAKRLKSESNAKIYTVGISGAFTKDLGKQLCGYLLNPTGADKFQEGYYTAATSAELARALSNIAETITGKNLTNLVVTDQLSKYVNYKDGLTDDGNGATIDGNGKITWNVASSLSAGQTRSMSYNVTVDNAACYQDINKLVAESQYSNTSNDLIGYYTGSKDNKQKLYYHSNQYAVLKYKNTNGEDRNMNFEHPVVEPEKMYRISIEKQIREGDTVSDNIEFEFNVNVDGMAYNGTITSSSNKTRKIENGKLLLNAGESVDIYLPAKKDGSPLSYEVTEKKYVETGIQSNLEKVIVNGTNKDFVNNTIKGDTSTGDVSIVFVNSYEIVGAIKVNKTINDYYSVHGNPVFFYRLDKINSSKEVTATYYDYIEFDIAKGFNGQDVRNGEELNSESSSIAKSITFGDLPEGTYELTEIQPIRYEFAGVSVNKGKGAVDTKDAKAGNNGKTIIVVSKKDMDIEVTYSNEKNFDPYFSHTDVVRNTITIKKTPITK